MSGKARPVAERFWSRVDKGDPTSCWLWKGQSNKKYGVIGIEGKTVACHRYSYEFHNGPIPKALVVRHKCDNPGCVNPNHLELGTMRDNSRDMVRRERMPGRLSLDQVFSIRKKRADGVSVKSLATEFGVSVVAVYNLLHNRTWKTEALDAEKKLKWDYRFVELARLVAAWSKDPSTQCGAVITRSDRTLASTGFNGFCRGMEDHPGRYHDREDKLQRIIHAEMNAILTAKESLKGSTLYTWPFISCHRCATAVIQAGITRCVAPRADSERETRWELWRTREYFRECGVELVEVESRQE